MNRIRKLELQSYYIIKTCVCGQSKHENRWCCLPCMKILHGSYEERRLDEACDEHFMSVEAYLEQIKNNKNRIIKGEKMTVLSPGDMSKFQVLVDTLKAKWMKVKPTVTGGFLSMMSFDKTTLAAGWRQVLSGVGELVNLADLLTIAGPDKKLLVIGYANDLLEFIIMNSVPIALRGFILPIESVLESLLDGMIEAAVDKLPRKVAVSQ